MKIQTNNMDKRELVKALTQEMTGVDDPIPFVEKTKYLPETKSLIACNILECDENILLNLKSYAKELEGNLKKMGETDYAKYQSALYVELAEACVDYVLAVKKKRSI